MELTFNELFPELNDSQRKMMLRELLKCVVDDQEATKLNIQKFINGQS